MPFSVNDIKFFYSGGSGNSNPQASLGGIISATAVQSQSTTTPVNVTGVTITSAVNNQEGVGVLAWSPSTNALSWQPPGSASVYSQSGITVDGVYVLGAGDGVVVLTVTAASLPASYKQDSITVSNVDQNVFDAVGPLDSLVGSVNYRCLYIKNTNPTISTLTTRVWIKQLTTGPDEIDIGLDPAGVGDGSGSGVATVIPDEDTAPAGVAFSRPTTYSTGLSIGPLAPGQCIALWERRTVDENTVGDISANSSSIAVTVTV